MLHEVVHCGGIMVLRDSLSSRDSSFFPVLALLPRFSEESFSLFVSARNLVYKVDTQEILTDGLMDEWDKG